MSENLQPDPAPESRVEIQQLVRLTELPATVMHVDWPRGSRQSSDESLDVLEKLQSEGWKILTYATREGAVWRAVLVKESAPSVLTSAINALKPFCFLSPDSPRVRDKWHGYVHAGIHAIDAFTATLPNIPDEGRPSKTSTPTQNV